MKPTVVFDGGSIHCIYNRFPLAIASKAMAILIFFSGASKMISITMKQDTPLVSHTTRTFSPLHIAEVPGRLPAMHPEDDVNFTALYRRYFPLVMQFVGIHSGPAHPDAEDIAQDIFLSVWRQRDRLLKIDPLEYYLFIMVKNRIINDTKKAGTRQRIRRQILQEPGGYAYGPHHEISSRKTERWWLAAIELLPPKPRTAYLLRELHGLKVYEIAALMGTSQAGTSRKLQEAEKRIKSFLARQVI
jgi:RNA polymerase sigma factor (sigma-70 family)